MQTRIIQWSEIAKHTKYSDVWFVVNNGVYDPTPFLEQHPGGAQILQNRAGQDVTEEFNNQKHSKGALAKLETLRVGTLDQNSEPQKWQKGQRQSKPLTYFSFMTIILSIIYMIYVLMNGPYKQQKFEL